MARSLKKGPFVDDHLMAKVEKLNETDKKQVVLQFSHNSSVTQSLSMTDANMYLFSFLKIW